MDGKNTAPEVEAPGREEAEKIRDNLRKMWRDMDEIFISLLVAVDDLTREK